MIKLFVVLSVLLVSSSAFPIQISEEGTHQKRNVEQTYDNCHNLDSSIDYTFSWSVIRTTLYIGLKAKTTGWLGIGFQMNGAEGMGTADYAITWIQPNKTLELQDRWLDDGMGLPDFDQLQNLKPSSFSSTNDGYLVVNLFRKLSTGDTAQDLDLTKIGMNFTLLWAHGSNPSGGNDPGYHGQSRGKVFSVNLFDSAQCTKNTCPNQCSGKGSCNNATSTCTCFPGWVGNDCSQHDLSMLKVAPGFKLDYFSAHVSNPRSMALSQSNPSLLYVGSWVGQVYVVIDANRDGKADEVFLLLEQRTIPNGVAWVNNTLFVAEATQVLRFDNIDNTFRSRPTGKVIISNIPTANSNWHAWKIIRASTNGRLYMPVGAPCNYCLRSNAPGDPTPTELKAPYATITSFLPDGSDWRVEASGVRNSVGLDFSPFANEIWFTDNGRDEWGENKPWDELNRLPLSSSQQYKKLSPNDIIQTPKQSFHYGFPFCYGYGTNTTTGGPDPLFNSGSCANYIGAQYELGPHVAPLGMRFYIQRSAARNLFPSKYFNSIFIAEHGSWNRPPNHLIGFRVVNLKLSQDGKKVVSQEIIAEGWLGRDKNTFWGRPVDIEQLPDGSLLISDDKGAIYRLTYPRS